MSKFSKTVLQRIYKRILGAMSGVLDVDVKVEEGGEGAYYSFVDKCIHMPYVFHAAEDDEMDFLCGRGTMVHEVSHVLFAPTNHMQKLSNGDNRFYECCNVFLDVNNEFKVTALFPNLKEAVVKKTEAIINSEKGEELLKSPNALLQVLLRCDTLVDIKAEFPEGYPVVAEEFVKRWVGRFKRDELHKAKGKPLINAAFEFYEEYKEMLKKVQDEECANQSLIEKLTQKQGQALYDGDVVEADKLSKQISEIDLTDWYGKITRGQSTYARGPSSSPVSMAQHEFADMDFDQVVRQVKNRQEQVGAGVPMYDIDFDSFTDDSGFTGVKVVDMHELEPPYAEMREPTDFSVARREGLQTHRNLLRRIMLEENYNQRHRSGRLDLRKVRRSVAKSGSLTSNKVFNRRNDFTRGGEWAVEVLVDCSGSMSGVKMKHAKRALATLAYAINGLPNVRFAITGFSDGFNSDTSEAYVQEFPVKRFSKRLDIKNITKLYASDANADGISIECATKRLLKFSPRIRKLLVVISDGMPAYNTNGLKGHEHTKRMIRAASLRGVKVIGIGIEGAKEDYLQEAYPMHYFFKESESLDKELTAVILNALHGGVNQRRFVKARWEE